MNTLKKSSHQAPRLKASVSLLNMFAERYLAHESPTSAKMALEVSISWTCRPVTA